MLAAEETTLSAGLEHERRLYELSMATEDRIEGMDAFLEKRKPRVQGEVTVANVFEPDFDHEEDRPGFTYRRARIGWQAGSERLGASLYELPPGQASFPYHWHAANEELLIVLSGRPSLRSPSGWRELAEGEVVAFPGGRGWRSPDRQPRPESRRRSSCSAR